MSKTNLDWIKSISAKASQIRNLLKERSESGPAAVDFFVGCYGNPDADVIFMPEIPSLSAKEVIKEAYCKRSDELWKTAWKVSIGDYLFRTALYKNGFIPEDLDPLNDEPSKWNCWITDFVKEANYTKSWNKMEQIEKAKVLSRSGDFLREELKILNGPPNRIRWVVFVGKKPTSYFSKYVKRDEHDDFTFNKDWVYHYAWPKSREDREKFRSRFRAVSENVHKDDK